MNSINRRLTEASFFTDINLLGTLMLGRSDSLDLLETEFVLHQDDERDTEQDGEQRIVQCYGYKEQLPVDLGIKDRDPRSDDGSFNDCN